MAETVEAVKPIGGQTYQQLLQILHKTQPSNCHTTPSYCKMMQLVRFYRNHFAHTIAHAFSYSMALHNGHDEAHDDDDVNDDVDDDGYEDNGDDGH